MCGLFVVITRSIGLDRARAIAATQALQHRGPDGTHHHSWSHSYATPGGPVAVSGFMGHTRLSILDPQTRSDQPFVRGAHTLAYNGEIYNFRALRQTLASEGQNFETDGDTEVLMALLQRKGISALHQANGMWAFCLLDTEAGQLLAARDRYGKKPLFYYADADTLCLSSEIAPIFQYFGRAPRMAAPALHSFLRYGWLYPRADGASHVDGIRQVVAGASLRVDLANWRFEEQPWFDLAQFSAETPHDAGALAATLEDAVCARLVADRRVGLLLSGGVDSSLILSVLCKLGRQDQVTCFTGDAGKSEDARYAQACIAQLGIAAIRVPLDYGNTGMDAFLNVCRHQEKPFPLIGNVLAMPQMYAEIARHDVPVVLDGTGGDEIFAGYWDRYVRFALIEALGRGDQAWIDTLVQANADDPRLHQIVQQALQYARQAPGEGSRPTGIAGLAEDPLDLNSFVAPEVQQAAAVDPLMDFRGTLAQGLVTDAQHGRLHEWLWQNDRNAMASGIENRSPLLDYRLAPWMHSGYQAKFQGSWNKHELRNLFPAFVALPTQWRRDKQGFRWVYSRFLRHNQAQVLELIEASRILPQCVDVGRLLDAARKDEAYLECSLLQRMLSVAGVEQAMGMSAGA